MKNFKVKKKKKEMKKQIKDTSIIVLFISIIFHSPFLIIQIKKIKLNKKKILPINFNR